ncbi:MAG: ABC-2 family transporter protein [Clostridia bacterium]|nr:ABC-2 family transporter protein [Clostridia bacterium]MBO4885112.1 ABC-2 family transporter protein [Clostridia bacterium]MBR4443319.1 ABC-2 family transporter protein [Clostridia bacterium]
MSETFRQTTFGLWTRYIRILALSQLQYKGWILGLLPNLVYTVTDPLDALLMFDRFGSLGEWTASRILLVYGLALFCFGLSEVVARGIDYFPQLVRSGEFDRLLLRPRPLLMQTAAMRFHLSRFNRVVAGGLLALVCLRYQGAQATLPNVAMLVLAVIGGTLAYAGVMLVAAAAAFFTIGQSELINLFTNGSYQVAKAPPGLLPNWLRRVFTFLMPMFLFTYYPAAAVCGWGGEAWLGWLALPVCALFFGAAAALWRFGVRHYRSTGS